MTANPTVVNTNEFFCVPVGKSRQAAIFLGNLVKNARGRQEHTQEDGDEQRPGYVRVLLSGRSLVFSHPTVHTQQSSVPNGVAEHNVTVARAFTKLITLMLCALFCVIHLSHPFSPKSMWMTSNSKSFEASGARARFAAAFTTMRLLWLMTSVVSGHPGLEG